MNDNNIYWAIDMSMDFYECEIDFDEKSIKNFGQKITEIINPGGEIVGSIFPFAEGVEEMEGFRLVHQNQDSLITAHFVNKGKRVYLDVHSCNPYQPSKLVTFCSEYLKDEHHLCRKTLRK